MCLLVVVLMKFATTLLAQSVTIVSTDQTSASMMQCQKIAVPTNTQGPGGGHARNILQMDLHLLLSPRGAHGMLAGRMPSPGLDLKPLQELEGQGMFTVCTQPLVLLNVAFICLALQAIVAQSPHTIMTLTSPVSPSM